MRYIVLLETCEQFHAIVLYEIKSNRWRCDVTLNFYHTPKITQLFVWSVS